MMAIILTGCTIFAPGGEACRDFQHHTLRFNHCARSLADCLLSEERVSRFMITWQETFATLHKRQASMGRQGLAKRSSGFPGFGLTVGMLRCMADAARLSHA
jgi:hypothetical protein